MRRARLFRRTPFRLAVVFTALFVVALLLSGFIAYTLMKSELVGRQDRRIEETWRTLSQEHLDEDIEDLVEAVALRVSSNSGQRKCLSAAACQWPTSRRQYFGH